MMLTLRILEYTTLAGLPQQGDDVVARLHQRRKVDCRKARRLGRDDGLFVWTQDCQQSEILSHNEWNLLPAQITVRIICITTTIRGFRNRRITLVTSLLYPDLCSAQELAGLYARRWQLELCLRNLKMTLGVEQPPLLVPSSGWEGETARFISGLPKRRCVCPANPLLLTEKHNRNWPSLLRVSGEMQPNSMPSLRRRSKNSTE
jgi:hypothetical protein